MSCVVMGNVTAGLPEDISMMRSRSSETRRMYPSLTVGEIAYPLWLLMGLGLVVEMDGGECILALTSCSFMSSVSTGESMKSTGSCGRVGASGQICVAITTSPGKLSPCVCMCASLSAAAMAATAPSASDTSPMRAGRAPMPPSRPTMPSVGAVPSTSLPAVPGITMRTKSVAPFGPPIRVTVTVGRLYAESSSTTVWPLAYAVSSASKTCKVWVRLMGVFLLAGGRDDSMDLFLAELDRRVEKTEQRIARNDAARENFHAVAHFVTAEPFEQQAQSDANCHSPAGHRVKDQQASGQQHAELALRTANPLNEGARNGPDKKLLRDTRHRARTDGGRVHLGHRRHHALRKIDAVRDVDHGNGDDEGQHLSDQLLLAACKLERRIRTMAAQYEASLEVITHIGKGWTGGDRKAAQHDQCRHRKTQQQTQQQGDQRHRKGGKPARVHCGDANDQFMHEGGECGIQDESDEHAHRHLDIQSSQQGDTGSQQDVGRCPQAQGGASVALGCGFSFRRFFDQYHADLHQRNQTGADHYAVRYVGFVDIERDVAAQQQTDTEHAQCPNVADECGAKRSHRNLAPRADGPNQHANSEQCCLLASLVASLDGLRRCHARRPCARSRKNFGVEQSVQQIAIQKHGQGDADEHRHHQIRPAHEKGNRNRQQQAVGSAESC